MAKLGDGGITGTLKTGQKPAGCGHQQADFVAQRPAFGGRYAKQRVPGRRKAAQRQPRLVWKTQCQRVAEQNLLHVHANLLQQTQCFGVGTNQNMLAVV